MTHENACNCSRKLVPAGGGPHSGPPRPHSLAEVLAEGRTAPGRRPVVVAAGGPAQGFTAFPRTTASPRRPGAACRRERHDHRRTHPACCIDQDGWVVNFPVGLRPVDLYNRRVRCQEPDNTGLIEQIERWTQP